MFIKQDIKKKLAKAFLIAIILCLSACSSLPHAIEFIPEDNAGINYDIFVVSHGWHTGIVIPAKLIQSRIPELQVRFVNAPYIEFGWGDKGFYQTQKITSGLTIKAIFWPTESILHVVAVHEKVYKYFTNSHLEKICLNDNQYSSLIRFIESSFLKNERGMIIELKKGIYGNSQFYKSVGDYYLMNTCNKWTAKALKSSGFNITPTFKLTAGSIMSYLLKYNQNTGLGDCSSLTKVKK